MRFWWKKNQGVWHLDCNASGGTNNPTKQSLIRSEAAGLSMKMMEDRFPTSPPAQQGSSLEPEPPWFPHQSTSSSRLSFISAAELPLASVAIRLLLLSRSLILSTKEISVQSRV